MPAHRVAAALVVLAMLGVVALLAAPGAEAARCGSALLLETSPPAALDGVDPTAPTVARLWEAGLAGSNGSDAGCRTGCTLLSGAACAGGGDCLALTGVSWLNATCAVPGHLPVRSVLLVEQTTAGSGGRWAAVNLDRNPTNANTDLDAKAAAACGGCASTLSPFAGGTGRPAVDGSSVADGVLTVDLSWTPPPAAAQALSNGADLVTGYGVHYWTGASPAPATTGHRTGWTRAPDTQPDGAGRDGYSTDTSATLELPLAGLGEIVTFAVAPTFDGTGNPAADAHTLASTYLSDDTDALTVPTACGEPNHLVLETETVTDTRELVACLTVTAGNGFAVGATGDVTLRAGRAVILESGFSVADGGSLAVVIDPALGE